MNRTTNYLLFCIALFFGIAIIFDRISKLHLFEGMDSTAPPAGAVSGSGLPSIQSSTSPAGTGAGPTVPSVPSPTGAGAGPTIPPMPSTTGAGAGPTVPSAPTVVAGGVKSRETKVKTYNF